MWQNHSPQYVLYGLLFHHSDLQNVPKAHQIVKTSNYCIFNDIHKSQCAIRRETYSKLCTSEKNPKAVLGFLSCRIPPVAKSFDIAIICHLLRATIYHPDLRMSPKITRLLKLPTTLTIASSLTYTGIGAQSDEETTPKYGTEEP